jgi:hypothetical protein
MGMALRCGGSGSLEWICGELGPVSGLETRSRQKVFCCFHIGRSWRWKEGLVLVGVTPDFTRKTECISYVRQDQVYTHMIDVMSDYP